MANSKIGVIEPLKTCPRCGKQGEVIESHDWVACPELGVEYKEVRLRCPSVPSAQAWHPDWTTFDTRDLEVKMN